MRGEPFRNIFCHLLGAIIGISVFTVPGSVEAAYTHGQQPGGHLLITEVYLDCDGEFQTIEIYGNRFLFGSDPVVMLGDYPDPLLIVGPTTDNQIFMRRQIRENAAPFRYNGQSF